MFLCFSSWSCLSCEAQYLYSATWIFVLSACMASFLVIPDPFVSPFEYNFFSKLFKSTNLMST